MEGPKKGRKGKKALRTEGRTDEMKEEQNDKGKRE